MRWISKTPPGYVWQDDEWYRETDAKVFIAKIENSRWEGDGENVPFPPKTYVSIDGKLTKLK